MNRKLLLIAALFLVVSCEQMDTEREISNEWAIQRLAEHKAAVTVCLRNGGIPIFPVGMED